jgi:hypothetical protein
MTTKAKGMNPLAKQGNKLFNLKSFNELKKDQTNLKIFKNSSFDSSFNSVQSLNTNLSLLLPSLAHFASKGPSPLSLDPNSCKAREENEEVVQWRSRSTKKIKNPKFSAILRAIRSIRLNRDEWKLIRYINLLEKKIRSSPIFPCLSLPGSLGYLPLSCLATPPLRGKGGCYSLRERVARQGAKDTNKVAKGSRAGVTTSSSIFSSHTCSNPPLRERPRQRSKVERGLFSYPLSGSKETKYLNIAAQQNIKIFSYNNIISKNILLRNMKYNFLKSTLSSILKKKIRKISEVLEDKPIKNYVLYSYLKNCIFSPPHLNGGRTKLSLNKYKGSKFGSFINYNKIIGYKFNCNPHPCLATLAQQPPLGEERGATPFPLRGGLQGKGINLGVGRLVNSRVAAEQRNINIKETNKLLFYLFKSMYCLISKPVLKYTNDKVTIQLFYYLNIPKKKIFRLFSISYINSIKKKWLAHIENKTKFITRSPLALLLHNPKGLEQNKAELAPSDKDSLALQPYLLKRERGSSNSIYSNNNNNNNNKGRANLFGPRGRVATPYGKGMVSNPKLFIRWKIRKAISRFKNKNISSKNLLFKLRKFNLTAKAVFQNKFKIICAILSNKFNKPVELQLIRLHHPYHDSNILVNLLSLNIKNKRKKARIAVQKIYNRKPVKNFNDPILKNPLITTEGGLQGKGNILPAFLSGLNIKIAGRLMGEPIIPRITTKVFGTGASATGKVNYLDVARITKKNRKGAYTIKITSGQNFF